MKNNSASIHFILVLTLESFKILRFSVESSSSSMCHSLGVELRISDGYHFQPKGHPFNVSSKAGAFLWVIYPFYSTFLGAVQSENQLWLSATLPHLARLLFKITFLQTLYSSSSKQVVLFHIQLGKKKPDIISQELPHLSITKSIHGSDLHVHKSPYSYAEPAPTYTLDHILSHFLKDFDSEMIPLPISLVSHSLQNYFQQHVNKLYCLIFKEKNPSSCLLIF